MRNCSGVEPSAKRIPEPGQCFAVPSVELDPDQPSPQVWTCLGDIGGRQSLNRLGIVLGNCVIGGRSLKYRCGRGRRAGLAALSLNTGQGRLHRRCDGLSKIHALRADWTVVGAHAR
jgi:hypothetical protein